jgi:hypothetical protein
VGFRRRLLWYEASVLLAIVCRNCEPLTSGLRQINGASRWSYAAVKSPIVFNCLAI